MEFKNFSAGKISYGAASEDKPAKEIKYGLGVTNVNFDDDRAFEHLKDKNHSNYQYIRRMREALGVCHAIIIEEKTSPEGIAYANYNASSPDELALVNGARHLGFEFFERDADNNLLCKIDGSDDIQRYKLLNIIEFDSARKRMSVIVKTPKDEIMIICKGADSIIEKRLKDG
jgi:magnesium-transporting ATPase (P-type)